MNKNTKKFVAGSAAVAVGAAAVVGGFAAFIDTDDAESTVDAGSVEIAFTDDIGDFQLEDSIVNVGYGDTWQRAFTIDNASSLDIDDLDMAVAASGGLSEALGMKVELCPVAWAEDNEGGLNADAESATPTYSCSGDTSLVRAYAAGNLDGAGISDDLADTLSDDIVDVAEDVFVRVTITFELPGTPEQAAIDALEDEGNTDVATTISYDFDATQRAADTNNR